MARTPPRISFGPADLGKFPVTENMDGTPAEGPRYLKVSIDLEAATIYELDLNVALDQEILSNVQAIKIDNADGLNAVKVVTKRSGERLFCAPGDMLTCPITFAMDGKLCISRDDEGTIDIFLFNVPLPTMGESSRAGSGGVSGSGNSTRVSVAASAVDTPLLASNSLRRGVTIVNDSVSETLFLGFGTAAVTSSSFSYELLPQATYEMSPLYLGPIRGIWTAAIGAARITEFS